MTSRNPVLQYHDPLQKAAYRKVVFAKVAESFAFSRARAGVTRKADLSPVEKLEQALREFKAINPDVWDGINDAYQSLVDKKFASGLSDEESERMERLGRALDRLVEPYDLARIAVVEEKMRGG